MTIKDEQSNKPFRIKEFIYKHPLAFTLLGILLFATSLVYHVETSKSDKWTRIVEEKPSLRIVRRGESNLLTSDYKIIKIDDVYHVSVTETAGSSYSYGISEIEIYEVIK